MRAACLCIILLSTMIVALRALRLKRNPCSVLQRKRSIDGGTPLRMASMVTVSTAKTNIETSQLAAGLSPEQFNAVHCSLNSSAIVVSGPGSGKTAVLTKRIAYLLQNKQRPSSILALTFTNKAASEMKERVKYLLEDLDIQSDNSYLFVGTFHAFCVRMLRTFGKEHLKRMTNNAAFDSNFSIVDSDDSCRYIREILAEKKISAEDFKPYAVLGAVQKAKLASLMAERSLDIKGDPLPRSSSTLAIFDCIKNIGLRNCAIEVMEAYSHKVYGSNSLDFEDLLMLTYRLFNEAEEVRNYLSDRYKHVLVDEFQDTNALQYDLVKVLFPISLGASGGEGGSQRSLFVVGDFDQSIYSWRGALPTNIDKLKKEYPGVQVYRLIANYRSTPHITTIANSILQKMATNSVKTGGNAKFAPVRVVKVESEQKEAEVITQMINAFGKRDTIALLYRTNAQSRVLEQGMVKAGIPYRLVGGSKFYDRKEIKDIMSYMRLLTNPFDKIALERSLNTPNRGIGPKTGEKFMQWIEASQLQYDGVNRQFDDVEIVQQRVPTVFDHFAWLQREHGIDVSFTDIGDLGNISVCPMNAADKKKLLEFGNLVSSLLLEARRSSLPMLITKLVDAINFKEYLLKQSDDPKLAADRFANVLELISAAKMFAMTSSTDGSSDSPVDGSISLPIPSPSDITDLVLSDTSSAASDHDENKQSKEEGRLLPPAITATCNQLLQFVQESLLYAGDVETFGGSGDEAAKKARVSLMTIHASKGLEFDTVFVTGCEDGFLPLNAFGESKDDEVAEEKRLLYVAVTRARSNLVLTVREQANVFKGGKMVTADLKMSRFLAPLTTLGKDVCVFLTYKPPK